MCGIWAYIELIKNKINHQELFNDFMNLKHRGPDVSSYQIIKNTTIGFHRLSIMEPGFHANQPYVLHDINRTIVFICNGEIYNFNDLIYHYKLPIYDNSDCLVIPHLYLKTIHYNHTGNNIDSFVIDQCAITPNDSSCGQIPQNIQPITTTKSKSKNTC